jgi:hypothetical protein
MYEYLWSTVHASICSITFQRAGERLGSGSGFKVGNKIITNHHVFWPPQEATHVAVRFVAQDGYTPVAEHTFLVDTWRKRLCDGDSEQGWDYAILDLPESRACPSLQLASTNEYPIGMPIALFGFQFDQQNLSIHTGSIASKFEQAGVRYLQLDASVNQGNSGGPLIRCIGYLAHPASFPAWRTAQSQHSLRPRAFKVFLHEARTQMHIQLDQWAIASAAEAVHLTCLDDQNVASFGLELVPVHVPQTPPFMNKLDLVIRMVVRSRTAARQAAEEERRDADSTVVRTHKVVRAATKR